jgi:hypothetical protein
MSSRFAAWLAAGLLGVGAAAGLISVRAVAQTSLPGGSYINSCTNISLVNGILEATCRTADQNQRSSALANPFNCANGVMNSNGKLMCDTGGAAPPMRRSGGLWDSIAVDDSEGTKGGKGGYGVGQGDTKAAAESAALSECRSAGNGSCSVEMSYQGLGMCGAYASSKKYYGHGTGPSQSAAAQAALNDCNDSSCKVLVTDCVGQN